MAGKILSADITLESRGTIKVGWFTYKYNTTTPIFDISLKEAAIKLADEISRQTPIKMAGKILSADITLESRGTIKVGWFTYKYNTTTPKFEKQPSS